MKSIIVLLCILLTTTVCQAALTVGNIPKTKTGGSTPALQDSIVTELNGNIGVGTLTPNSTLDIGSGIATVGAISGVGVGAFQLSSSNGIGFDGQHLSYASNQLYLPSYGGVAIGDVNAPYILSIWGGGTVGAINTSSPSATSGGIYRAIQSGSTGVTTGTRVGGYLVSGKYISTQVGYYDGGGLQFFGSEPWTVSTAGTEARIYTTSSGAIAPTQKMVVTSSGNVGIATTTPAFVLDVRGSSSTSGIVSIGDGTGGSGIIINGAGDTNQKNVYWKTAGSNRWRFTVNGTESTSNAGSDMSLVRYDDTGSSLGSVLTIERNTGNIGFNTSSIPAGSQRYVFKGAGTTTGINSQWTDSSTTAKVTIQDNGNTGIGTTTPKSKLDINGGAVIGSTLAGITAAPTDGLLVVGNIGVGSVTPSQKLDVTGTVRATAFVGDGSGLTGISGSGSVANPTGTIGLAAVNGSASSALRSDGAPALSQAISPTWTGNHTFAPSSGNTLFSAGNVGVGSATPGQILDVTGTVRATSFSGSGAALTGISGSLSGMTTNSVQKATSSSTIGNTVMWEDGTNVGIGSVNPTALLCVGSTCQNKMTTAGITQIGGVAVTISGTAFTGLNSGAVVTYSNSSNTSGASVLVKGSGATNGFVNIQSTASGSASGDYTKFTGGVSGNTEIMRVTGAGNVGIGTTIPNQAFVLKGSFGHQWGFSIPAISSCGTSPSVKGTDNDFQITVGSVSATGCTATFSGTYQDASCVVTNQSMSVVNALTYTVSNTAVVISQTALTNALLNVHCDFKN